RSQLRYTHALFALWLADSHLRQQAFDEARALTEETLSTARELGYRHVEGVARRLLGESLTNVNATLAAEELALAETILEELDVRNELGKVWVARACLRHEAPDRQLLTKALALFRNLETVDETRRVERLLASDPL